jgi:alpha-glucosidase
MAEAPGDHDPTNVTGSELLLRWIQFGVVAPVFRTHCNHCERRIWMFPYHFEQMRDAMQLRNALGPYLYTEARAFFDTAVAPVHPLYYEEPRNAALYALAVVERVFMHGDRLLAAPITTMTGDPNGTLPWELYLPATGGPPGSQWSNWNGSATYDRGPLEGGVFGLGDIPLFVRGGVLPLKTMASVAGNFPDPLVWALFPGSAAGGYTLYEDDGDSDAYRGGEYVTQAVNFTRTGDSITLTASPAASSGALPPGFPSARGLVVQVRGMAVAPRQVQVNGLAVPEAAEGVSPGWYLVGGGGGHSPLLLPQGTLVVSAGQQSSWDVAVVSVML